MIMKGLTNNLYIAFLIIFGMIALMFMMTYPFMNNLEPIVVKRDSFIMSNSLDYGEIISSDILLWSYYQGCYETLANGGYSEIGFDKLYQHGNDQYALWYNNGDITPDYNQILTNLETDTAKKMNLYGGGYEYYELEVQIPKDYTVKLEKIEGKLTGKAVGSMIFVNKETENVKTTLKKSSLIEREFDIDCTKILTDNSAITGDVGRFTENVVINEINNWIKSGQKTFNEAVTISDQREMADTIFIQEYQKSIDTVENEIKDNILAGIAGFETAALLEVLSVGVIIEPECVSTIKEGETVTTEIACEKFTYNVDIGAKVTVVSDYEIPVNNGETVGFYSPSLVSAVRVNRVISEHIEVSEINGAYSFYLSLGDYPENVVEMALVQNGDSLAWATEQLGGVVQGTGYVVNGRVTLTEVPIIILDEFGEGVAYSIDFSGDLYNNVISGDLAAKDIENNQLTGTFTTSDSSGDMA